MSIVEAQRFLQDACWDDISGDKLISLLGQTEPSNTALARLAQNMGYAVVARDVNELKNDENLTKQPKHDRYTRLIIGGQEWHVCNLFLDDEDLESEGEEIGEVEEEVLEEWNEYLLEIGEDGSLELEKRIIDDLCLDQGGGCYLVCKHSSSLSSGHLICLYSDAIPDPTSGGYDAHLKVADKENLVVDRHILDRVGLHSGNWVSVKTSTITNFCAYIYRAFQRKAPNASIILTGPELLAKVKELDDVSKSDLIRRCGYVSYRADGSERLDRTAFYEALLDAKGVSFGRNGGNRDKRGCKLNYITTVQANGNLLIGKAYTAMLDLRPSDEFEIKLGSSQIRLVPLGDTEGKSDEAYVRLSTRLDREGDFEGAIAAITIAINLNPRMAPWYLNRAQTWMTRHRWSEAIEDCTKALVDCDPLTGGPVPFRCIIYSQRAIARVGMGDWSAACAEWQALLVDRPGDIEALVGLTLAYGHLDQSQQAENCWQEVSARQPSSGTLDWFADQCLHPWQGPLEVAMRQLFAETSRTREENMGHIPVVSTNVGYIAYDPETSELQIAFKDYSWEEVTWDECRKYRYTDVPAHIFAGLKNADSKGSYIYHNIAFMYEYERIYRNVP